MPEDSKLNVLSYALIIIIMSLFIKHRMCILGHFAPSYVASFNPHNTPRRKLPKTQVRFKEAKALVQDCTGTGYRARI